MVHIRVVQTVLRRLVRGLDDSGSGLSCLSTTLGSLLLYNFEYLGYAALDSKKQEYLTGLVRVRSYHDRKNQYTVHDKAKRSDQQSMDDRYYSAHLFHRRCRYLVRDGVQFTVVGDLEKESGQGE